MRHIQSARIRVLPCNNGTAPRSARCMCLRAACIAAAVENGAVQRSRRGAQGYHYGGSRHSLLIAGFQHESQTNERTNARSFARSPSLCFPRRARTHNAERETGTAFPCTCLAWVCKRTDAREPRWRDECMYTGVDTNAASIESRISFSLFLFP